MNHSNNFRKYEYTDCSGPRPPVLGKESSIKKMTEGNEKTQERYTNPPSYLNWARSLAYLLDDRDGVELLKKYVEEEAPTFNDHMNFFFACEGLKQQSDSDKIKQIIQAIYRFLRKSQLSISEDIRRIIKDGRKDESLLSANIFDGMQKQVEATIQDNIYPSFLCSEMYIQYIQKMSVIHERFAGSNGSAGSVYSNEDCSATGNTTSIPSSTLLANSNPVSVGTTVNSICAGAGINGSSTSASSSGSLSATDTLPRSSTLPTLHEDIELSLSNEADRARQSCESNRSAAITDMPVRLTRDLLLATQNRRLEIRPPGALGYVYTGKPPHTSYVPNSRIDSDRASVSSGGRTDSDTISLSNCSTDGRPYVESRHNSSKTKAIRQSALANKETNSFQVIPRTQRLYLNENRPLKQDELLALLIPKLEEVKRQQELEEKSRQERFSNDFLPGINERLDNDRAFAQAIREKFSMEEDNDQDILDQHVSRVWKDQTPHRSPGTVSPCPPLPTRRRNTLQDSGTTSEIATSLGGIELIKHSKSIPEHCSISRKLNSKWPSVNTDSGISLFSTDTLMKYKENNGIRSNITSIAPKTEEHKRRQDDEMRRSLRRFQQQTNFNNNSNLNNISNNVSIPPPLPAKPHEATSIVTTTVVFLFCDEEYPYRTKIPGCQPTLKQFKDYLPKKGNFRFFFKTHCDELESPVIQEEIVNDTDILPLFEGKVMGLVKTAD